MVCTIYQQLSPAEVRGQLERVVEQLLEPFPQVAEQLAEQHDEWAEARRKGKSGGTEFAQPLLCPTAIITLLLNRFDAQFGSPNGRYGSPNRCYVMRANSSALILRWVWQTCPRSLPSDA